MVHRYVELRCCRVSSVQRITRYADLKVRIIFSAVIQLARGSVLVAGNDDSGNDTAPCGAYIYMTCNWKRNGHFGLGSKRIRNGPFQTRAPTAKDPRVMSRKLVVLIQYQRVSITVLAECSMMVVVPAKAAFKRVGPKAPWASSCHSIQPTLEPER